MAGFLYFIPTDKPIVTPELLREVGLGYALEADNPGCDSLRTSGGPDGLAGLIVSIGATAEPRPFNAQRQIWRKAAGGKFWIGLENDARPGPEDLVRIRKISGEPVKLADGNDWTIPVCFSILRGTSLPKLLVLDEDGESWNLEMVPEFVKLCTDAATIWEAVTKRDKENTMRLSAPDAMRISVEALAVNYRISKYEISFMRLIDTGGMWLILKALVDLLQIERNAAELHKESPVGAA